jgi:hypothetical protein
MESTPIEAHIQGCTKSTALFRMLTWLKTVHANMPDTFLETWAEILIERHWSGKRNRGD